MTLMQTFLPYPDFAQSAACLDNKRLGKQRVECLQILNTLIGRSKGWINHPAVLMWKGYEGELKEYAVTVCYEWIKRGFKDTCISKIENNFSFRKLIKPPWLGNEAFHASHRSNLLRKDPVWYGKFGWKESNDLPYIWPTKEGI
jgi:hypothetical protein